MASVVKRDGTRQPVRFNKILERVEEQKRGLNVDTVRVAKTVVQGVRDGITTTELDELTIDTAASLAKRYPFERFQKEWFQLLNNKRLGDKIRPGQKVKMVTD